MQSKFTKKNGLALYNYFIEMKSITKFFNFFYKAIQDYTQFTTFPKYSDVLNKTSSLLVDLYKEFFRELSTKVYFDYDNKIEELKNKQNIMNDFKPILETLKDYDESKDLFEQLRKINPSNKLINGLQNIYKRI